MVQSRLLIDSAAPSLAQSASANGSSGELVDCWNQIGVRGDGSCPELQKFVHCRNCPIYSSAGAALLDRPLPTEYRREWTRHFAEKENQTPPAKTSVVLFRIQNEWLALPTHTFQEIAELRQIHSLPHRRGGTVLGLANIRGELLICVSLGRLLGVEQRDPREPSRHITTYDRLMVVNWDDSRLAFPVAEVPGIHRFQAHELKDAPATVAHSNRNYTQGVFLWQGRAVGLLDATLLFSTLNRSLT